MPDWPREIRKRLAELNLDPLRESEIVEELTQYISDKYEDLLAEHVSEEDAYASVTEELNSGKLIAEFRSLIMKDTSTSIELGEPVKRNFFDEFFQNLRYGLRLLRLNPGFAIVAILSLALGIGANTAIFQLLNAVRLRTLPVEKPQQLANIKLVYAPHGRAGRVRGYNAQLTYALW